MNFFASPPLGRRSLVSGTVAGIVTSLLSGLAARQAGIPAAAPTNAVSHVLWGRKAAARDRPSAKYTLSGFIINHLASIVWAAVYEKFFGTRARRGDVAMAVAGGVLVSAAAYMVDYYVVPKRFTPGYEKRLAGPALFLIYGGLAFSLVSRGLTTTTPAEGTVKKLRAQP